MGEWNKEGIPHKGWKCIDVIDLAECSEPGADIPYEQCEMCGNERIRFAHIMKHPQYFDELHVGCVCAEKMEEDYINPRRRENVLRNRAARKSNFNKIQWRFNSEKETYSKKYKGEYITIMRSKYGNWCVFFASQRIWDFDGRKMWSFEEAENIAFYIFEKYHTTRKEREYRF